MGALPLRSLGLRRHDWLGLGALRRAGDHGQSVWSEPYRWRPAHVYFWQPPNENTYAWVPLAPGEPYIHYNSFTYNTVGQYDAALANFRPRRFHDGRGLLAISALDLERRARPERLRGQRAKFFVDQMGNLVKLPKPKDLVGRNQLARLRPNDELRRRAVVVDDRGLQRLAKAERKAFKQDQRAVQKAERKALRDRAPAAPGRGKAGAQGRARRAQGAGQTTAQGRARAGSRSRGRDQAFSPATRQQGDLPGAEG